MPASIARSIILIDSASPISSPNMDSMALASGAEHQAAQAEGTHLHAGPAKVSVLHRSRVHRLQSIGSKKVRSAPKLSIAMT